MADHTMTSNEPVAGGATECAPTASPTIVPASPLVGSQSTFWFCFWLAVALVGTKAVNLGLPEFTISGLRDYAHDLAAVTHADVLFAIAVGLTAQVAIVFSVRRPRLQRMVWGALAVFCSVCVVYAVASVQIYDYLRSPLTYPLIYLAGDMKNMRSSVTAFASVPFVTAMVGVPMLYLILARTTHRFVQPKRTVAFRAGQGLGVIALSLFWIFGRYAFATNWGDKDDHLLAQNPHWVLVASCVEELFGGRMVQLDESYPPEHTEDFRTVAERPAGAAPTARLDHGPRNVIIFTLESTGTQYLRPYGSRYNATPRLQAEAAHSLVFDNFYCHVGLTANATVAMALSIYPGMTWREYTLEYPKLPGTTLADVLRPHGYRTAFIMSGDLEYTNLRGFLQNRGFDDLWDYRDLGCGPPIFSWGVEDRCLVDTMLKWIDRDRERPFFMLSWNTQTHHPYELSPGQKEIDFFQGDLPPDDYDLGLYLNCLYEVDRQLGRLLDGLRARGLADDTLVVIVGDHGEAFGYPHNTYGHGGRLYEENVHVPLMFWNPKLYPGGQRSETVGSQIDLNPTVLDVLGLPAAGSWQGRSLFDPARPPRAYFYAANTDYLLGVREQNWKYIYNAHRGREELFDLANDPMEQTNVAREQPEICQRLRQRLAAWMAYEREHLAKLHGSARP